MLLAEKGRMDVLVTSIAVPMLVFNFFFNVPNSYTDNLPSPPVRLCVNHPLTSYFTLIPNRTLVDTLCDMKLRNYDVHRKDPGLTITLGYKEAEALRGSGGKQLLAERMRVKEKKIV